MSELNWIHVENEFADGIVCEQGAHVSDWTPADDAPVLFLSGAARMEPGRPIRGGIPVVFPWFGEAPERGGRPAHGFARSLPWQVLEVIEAPESVRVALELVDDEETRASWPHRFGLRLDARFGATLDLSLRVENRDDQSFRFEAALHSYLAVGDVREVTLRGLEGATFVDKLDGNAERTQGQQPLTFDRETDRIYAGSTAVCCIDDPVLDRTIEVQKEGSHSTIVWNPWIDKAARMPDFGDDEWLVMLCVESGNVGRDAITLAPGGAHEMHVRIATSRLVPAG